MGDKSGIEWTDATWNAVTGCDKVSPGCDHCYALTLAARMKRLGQANYQNDGDPRTSGPGFGVTCHPHMLDKPLRWKRPRRIFVNSMSDMFHPDVPPEFIAKMFAVMACAPQHEFQVLTKRPQRMRQLLASDVFLNEYATERNRIARDVKIAPDDERPFVWPLAHVQLGVTIESDAYTWRANHLRGTPAAVRFISAEPLLGPLPSLDLTGIDWLIVGSESGSGARPMDLDWIRALRDMCAERPAVCTADPVDRAAPSHSLPVYENGKMVGGRPCTCAYPDPVAFFVKQISDGTPKAVKDIEAFPVDLRIRERVGA